MSNKRKKEAKYKIITLEYQLILLSLLLYIVNLSF